MAAMTSLVMMIAVRTVHPPMVHLFEHCLEHGSCGSPTEHQQATTVAANATSASREVASSKGSHTGKSCGPSHSCQPVVASCSHGHVHSHAKGHVHSHSAQSHSAEHAHDSCPSHQHSHSDHCELCQFLTQVATPITCEVQLVGQERVSEVPVSEVRFTLVAIIVGPHVRGPPVAA
jgi:hypothetical protein